MTADLKLLASQPEEWAEEIPALTKRLEHHVRVLTAMAVHNDRRRACTEILALAWLKTQEGDRHGAEVLNQAAKIVAETP